MKKQKVDENAESIKFTKDLQKKLNPYFKQIEDDLNSKVYKIDLNNDLQPGSFYYKQTITGLNTNTDPNSPYIAGDIKDFFVYRSFLESNVKTIKFLWGYAFCARVALSPKKEIPKILMGFIEQTKLSIKEITRLSPDSLTWGEYYIKFHDIEDVPNAAAYSIKISTNVLPIVEIGETNTNKYKT